MAMHLPFETSNCCVLELVLRYSSLFQSNLLVVKFLIESMLWNSLNLLP
jgi:hypothetical protein